MKSSRTVFVLAALLIVAAAGNALGDMYFKQVSHTDSVVVMGQKQPERFDTTEVWITEGKAYSQTNDGSGALIDLDQGKMYVFDHKGKEYMIMPIDLTETVDEAAGGEGEEGAEEAAEMKEKMKAMIGAVTVSITPTTETKKIGSWGCLKYTGDMAMAMMKSKMEIWATEDIKCDWSLYKRVTSGLMNQMPGFEQIIREMEKIKGLPVLTLSTTEVMGTSVKSTTELLEYSEKSAPAGAFAVPAGYTKVVFTGGMGGQ